MIIRREIFGEEHSNVTKSYNNLGNVYQNLGEHIEAKEYYETTLIMKRKRISTRKMPMSQQVITTWEMFVRISDSRMKEKRIPRESTDHQKKDFWRGACQCRNKL